MALQEIPEAWETYPAVVDDNPAMFFLNMGLVQAAPIEDAPFLYLVKIEMNDPGDNGLGTGDEAEGFMPIEDGICESAKDADLYFVGRVRTAGHWEMGFYGAPGVDLAVVLDRVGPMIAGRKIMLGGGDDPQWEFMLGYLAPDRERWQWIMDHRVARQLLQAGDEVDKPRTVDHAAHFPTEAKLDAFVAAAKEQGFRESQRHEDKEGGGELPWMVEVQREDPVGVNEIHEVVMGLIELVESNNGDYDGWGCSVTQ